MLSFFFGGSYNITRWVDVVHCMLHRAFKIRAIFSFQTLIT